MADTAPATGMMVDAYDKDQQPVTVYSTTGTPRTEAEFSTALTEYNTKGAAPKGYTVLQPGAMDWMRRNFEKVQAVVQPQLTKFGESMGETLAAPFTLAGQALGGPVQEYTEAGRQGAVQTGGRLGQMVGQSVDQPGEAAANIALAAFPVTRAVSSTARALPELKPLTSKMLQEGLTGAAAYAGGEAATGNVLSPGEAVMQFLPFALGSGVQGIWGHFVSRHIPKQRQNEVAEQLIGVVEGTKPTAGSTPYNFDEVASGSAKFGEMVQKGANGLRGGMDDTINTLITDINNVLPRNLSVPQQATLRAHTRDIYSKGNAIVDHLGNPTALAKAQTAYETAVTDMYKFVQGAYPTIANTAPMMARVDAVMRDKTNQLMEFRNGAELLSLLKEAGQEGGFSPVKLADVMRNRYLGSTNPAERQVGQVLGQGQSLLDIPEGGVGQQGPSLMGELTNLVQKRIPGLNLLPPVARTAPTPGVMPWQMPVDATTPTARAATQLTTQGGFRSLAEKAPAQKQQQEKKDIQAFTK